MLRPLFALAAALWTTTVLAQPPLPPAPAMLGVAMFSGNRNRVRDVYVAGRAIISDGHHALEGEAAASFGKALARLRSAP